MKGPVISDPARPKANAIVQRHKQMIMASTMVPHPIVGECAEGALVSDPDGNAHLNFSSAVAVMNVGYNHPDVRKAILDQGICILEGAADKMAAG